MNNYFNRKILSMILLGVEPPYNNSSQALEQTRLNTERALASRESEATEDLAIALAEFADGAAFGVARDWRTHHEFLESLDSLLEPLAGLITRDGMLEPWSRGAAPRYALGDNSRDPAKFPDVLNLGARRFVSGDVWWVTPEECAITLDESVVKNGKHFIRDDFQVASEVHPLPPLLNRRIYQVTDVDSWSQLADQYGERKPISTYDWGLKSNGEPIIPNWSHVSKDWDAVYVSVSGYIESAYSPAPLGGEDWTVLAGWHPGSTVWLHSLK